MPIFFIYAMMFTPVVIMNAMMDDFSKVCKQN